MLESDPFLNYPKNTVVHISGYINIIRIKVCIQIHIDGFKRSYDDLAVIGIFRKVDIVQIVTVSQDGLAGVLGVIAPCHVGFLLCVCAGVPGCWLEFIIEIRKRQRQQNSRTGITLIFGYLGHLFTGINIKKRGFFIVKAAIKVSKIVKMPIFTNNIILPTRKRGPTMQQPSEPKVIMFERILNHEILNELLKFQMKNNPDLEGMTKADIAKACDMSESTLKNLLNGKNDNPQVGTLKRFIEFIGGGSIDRMVGLAPPRDFEEEEAVYDANLVQSIQIQLGEKRAQIEELQNQLAMAELEKDRLRKIVLEKGEAKSKACAELAAKIELIEEYKGKVSRRDALVKHRNIAILVLAALVIIISIASALGLM